MRGRAPGRVPDTPGYHVRLYDPSDPSAPALRGEAAALLRKHQGIFEPAGRGHCVQVKVEEPDLSGLRLTNLPRSSTDQDNCELFRRILKTDLTPEEPEEAKERWSRFAARAGAPRGAVVSGCTVPSATTCSRSCAATPLSTSSRGHVARGTAR